MQRKLKSVGTLLLALLVALLGARLDLCACDATSHGFFCADTSAVEVQASGCCASSCCDEASPTSLSGPEAQAQSPTCGCPVLDLAGSPTETSVAPTLTHAHALSFASLAGDPGVALAPWTDTDPQDRVSWLRRRGPTSHRGLRRHLELHVLRC